jgi:hypothetical protein
VECGTDIEKIVNGINNGDAQFSRGFEDIKGMPQAGVNVHNVYIKCPQNQAEYFMVFPVSEVGQL